MDTRFLHGIRFRLVLVALVLLALPWLAAQFIASMEAFLRDSQEQAVGNTARAIGAALSDRPQLFRASDDRGWTLLSLYTSGAASDEHRDREQREEPALAKRRWLRMTIVADVGVRTHSSADD